MSGGRLAGRVAVVTGGSSGLGRAGVLRFAAEGAKVAIGALQPAAGAELAAQLGPDAFYLDTDVRRGTEVEALVTAAEERWERVDILYASAGVMPVGTAPDTSEEDYQLAVDVNLGGCFRLAKYGIPALARAGGGSVILTGSELGLVGAAATAAYCAAKGGVVNLTRQIAVDFGPRGIICNAVAPGKILTTPIDEPDTPETLAYSHARTPFPRLGQPEDVASLAVFLASDECTYMSGANVLVDGGWMAY